MIPDLRKYAQKGYNVLLEGRRGGGKSAIIKQVFNEVFGEQGERWMYFSGSTMDPWIHLMGIPKIVKDPVYGEVTRTIPPESMLNENIEAFFIDEFNRGPEEVRNALMELLQFKSINGRRFPNLKVVWAAVNPSDEDEGYDVEPLDPAQLDRFDCMIQVPCKPSVSYFRKTFGADGEAAVNWWKELPQKGQDEISPRRLEKLVRGIHDEVNIKPMVPATISVSGLEGRILGEKRKQALLAMLSDVRVPMDAKRQAVSDQVIRAKKKVPIDLNEVASAIGKEVLFELLEAMPRNEVSKNAEALRYCLEYEKETGCKQSRWTIKEGTSGLTAESMRTLILKSNNEEGLAHNIGQKENDDIEKISRCYKATLEGIESGLDPADALLIIKQRLADHRSALENASPYQLGLGWVSFSKLERTSTNGTLGHNVMTYHFRKALIHADLPELLYRWIVGIGMGNAWLVDNKKTDWSRNAKFSGIPFMGLKFLGNSDTRGVLENLSLNDEWEQLHGITIHRLKIAMQIGHAKMDSVKKALLADSVDEVGEEIVDALETA